MIVLLPSMLLISRESFLTSEPAGIEAEATSGVANPIVELVESGSHKCRDCTRKQEAEVLSKA